MSKTGSEPASSHDQNIFSSNLTKSSFLKSFTFSRHMHRLPIPILYLIYFTTYGYIFRSSTSPRLKLGSIMIIVCIRFPSLFCLFISYHNLLLFLLFILLKGNSMSNNINLHCVSRRFGIRTEQIISQKKKPNRKTLRDGKIGKKLSVYHFIEPSNLWCMTVWVVI